MMKYLQKLRRCSLYGEPDNSSELIERVYRTVYWLIDWFHPLVGNTAELMADSDAHWVA